MTRTRVASAREVLFGGGRAPAAARAGLEQSFFKSICLANGTHKTTAPGRLRDVDQVVCDQFRRGDVVRLLDVGLSSGVTTAELLDRLEGRGVRVRGTGADLCVRGGLCSVPGLDVLYDARGHVLQVATPFFARGRPHRSQRSLPSRALRLSMDVLGARLVRGCLARLGRARPVTLISPRLLARPDFEVVEHDIARPRPTWDGAFDLIRAANVLNLDYFPPDQLRRLVDNLAAWLRPGGLLVICRTDPADGSNHGTLYRKGDGPAGLDPVCRLGRGSDADAGIAAAAGPG